MSIKSFLTLLVMAFFLSSCGTTHSPKSKTSKTSTVKTVRISHITHKEASPELMLHSMSLIGTPYRYGGSSRNTGFDCSGMVQHVYQAALGVKLPRTARDMASAGIKISKSQLKVGDLVFFAQKNKISHVGLYIGNNQFIHAPSSGHVIRTNRLNDSWYAQHFVGARTYFVK